jgi:hypothetical protein
MLIIVLLLLLLLAVLGPLWGADTRRSGGWSRRDADGSLWSEPLR